MSALNLTAESFMLFRIPALAYGCCGVLSVNSIQQVSAQMPMPSPGMKESMMERPCAYPRKASISLRAAPLVQRVNSVGMAKAGLGPT